MIPPPDEWNAAVRHSKEHPTHTLGPYEDRNGNIHMDCAGCTFDTASPRLEDRQHGTRSTFLYGCRCQPCTDASREYKRQHARKAADV